MRKPLVTLENWAVVQKGLDLSYKELLPGKRLLGNVFGHTSLPDTKLVYTSTILSVDMDERIVETLNTVYQLGEPSDSYRTWKEEQREAAA